MGTADVREDTLRREMRMPTSGQFDRHLVGSMSILAEQAGDIGLISERDQVVITAVGRGPDEFNTAWVLDAPTEPTTTLEWVHDQLAARSTPFMVQVPEELSDEVGGILEDLGLELSHCAPGMTRATTTDIPPPPEGLRITQVRDAAALEAHVLATAIGFGAPDASAMEGVMPPSLLEDDRVTFFNGYVDEVRVPAATAVSVVAGGVAGIYAVTVHEAARRRGFGTAMTWAALAAGARGGVDEVVLQSSDMGRPVYERMGFTQVRAHHRYRPAGGT